eukprot:CAMPEP_0183396076 /NCGR_PEP_ID=MMETSP0370-20130417/9773_1 /TAXON_ID=268820 /ORGANISM="Peridinium aciculiferum, Strain PAER-2" /LENGTH=84 /DNA_ID=CAMNT_0025576815 /DNA_START=71 /DNA_END=323 /DNA_ORIENTATION=-
MRMDLAWMFLLAAASFVQRLLSKGATPQGGENLNRYRVETYSAHVLETASSSAAARPGMSRLCFLVVLRVAVLGTFGGAAVLLP